jgi:transcriptional regulator with XRE-family HTH domain
MLTMGEKIREARLQRGLTQSDLGADLVSGSMVSQIEADKTRPSFPLLTAIANRLGLPTEHFMSELDDQFEFSAYTLLGEYYLVSQQPRRTVEILTSATSPNAPGRHRQEYLLLLARAHRQLGEYVQAVKHLEDLREQAFRLQDGRLMFSVLKESGYVEYGMENVDGAMFEWTKAIELGESLLRLDDISRVDISSDLTDLHYAMYRIHSRLGQTDAAAEDIQKAATLSRSFGRFRDIAEEYIRNAISSLDTADTGFAKGLIERAVYTLNAVRLVEQYILIHTKYNEANGAKPLDPWEQAAIATATADPGSFIKAELERIDQCIERGEAEAATRRIERCFEIIDDYRREIPIIGDWVAGHKYQLFICKARVEQLLGNAAASVAILEETLQALQSSEFAQAQLEVCAHLVKCYAEADETQRVYELSEHMETLLESIKNRAALLG